MNYLGAFLTLGACVLIAFIINKYFPLVREYEPPEPPKPAKGAKIYNLDDYRETKVRKAA